MELRQLLLHPFDQGATPQYRSGQPRDVLGRSRQPAGSRCGRRGSPRVGCPPKPTQGRQLSFVRGINTIWAFIFVKVSQWPEVSPQDMGAHPPQQPPSAGASGTPGNSRVGPAPRESSGHKWSPRAGLWDWCQGTCSSSGLRGLRRRFRRLRRKLRLTFLLAFAARRSFRSCGFRRHRFHRIGGLAASSDDAGRRMFADSGKLGAPVM